MSNPPPGPAKATFAAVQAEARRMPTTLDLAEIYFDEFGAGSIGATCEHLNSAVIRRGFRYSTIAKLRPIADQLAAERTDARVFEPSNPGDHPWYLIIGRAPARRKLTGDDVITTLIEDFGVARWVHPADLVKHVQRRVNCSAYRVSLVCGELAERRRGRIRGEMDRNGEGDWAFRID